MTLDSSRTHRSDPEGLIQSYVLRVEEKNRLAESEWKKESASCFHADSLPDSQHIRSKKPRKPRRWQMRRSGRGRGGEWSKFDSSGSQTQGGMGSDRLLSLPERGEQEDRAGGEDMWVQELRPWQQRMDWFSQQQKENEKRLSLQHAQSAAPTRSSTGGMPRDAEAAGRCADWVQQLDEQPFVPARRRRYLKLEHTPKAPKPVPVMRKVWPSNVFRREEEQGAAEKPRSASAASLQAASGGRGEERASRTGGSTRSLRSEGSRGRIISAGLSRPLIY
uniref:Uncharacterized protein n=1 Tax=Guillardia theta TaxID=55529 RepID=A0A7S4PBD2_GUITH|mmetsp:Transcript_47384/g.148219  ORF Transcript_47384/g.148219 Transcript_47384/m.148219 type:complete len:277 (+) Transcript_47384:225-1055(+)